MKDLKENIKKHNMKKLVLSVALGMFCCCTNNAMEEDGKEEPQIKSIIDVLGNMILDQVKIIDAKEAIKEKEKKIYATIKDKSGKVTKENLLKFIKKQFEVVDEDLFAKGIDYLEQYFHLEKIKEKEECTKDNLTEIFWEAQEEDEVINEVDEDIQNYLIKIADSEGNIRVYFQEYYQVKKAEKTQKGKGEAENVKYMVIEEIMKECYKGDENNDPNTKFLAELEEICKIKEIKDKKNDILEAIQRRITLDKEITKKTLKSFIRKKIEIEETKKVEPEEEKKDFPKGDKPAEEECCHCC